MMGDLFGRINSHDCKFIFLMVYKSSLPARQCSMQNEFDLTVLIKVHSVSIYFNYLPKLFGGSSINNNIKIIKKNLQILLIFLLF